MVRLGVAWQGEVRSGAVWQVGRGEARSGKVWCGLAWQVWFYKEK